MSDLRIAVLGVGMMGADHVARIQSRISGARVAVINDYVSDKAEEIAAGIDGCQAIADPLDAIADPDVDAVVLATSEACPVQAFKVGEHAYATQFHPELDTAGVCSRIEVYKDAGYFPPEEAEALQAYSRSVEVTHPMRILANFVDRYAR